MMEISKGLRKEIMLVQNKLKNAIRDHQICMGKLEDNSNNTDILRQIEEIRLHIISLGRCQKQVVQRLRKEVESYKAENVNGAKVSIASLLGLNHNNNNNNSTNNNNKNNTSKHVVDVDDEEKEEITQVKVQSNGIFDRRLSKENYEGVVRNGVVTASRKNTCAKECSISVETSCVEEDVIEVSDDEQSSEKHGDSKESTRMKEAPVSDQSKLNSRQVMFLGSLGLITASKFSELQNKRAERKRRSTANPQFVYSNWDIPTKRKRHSYLQSIGNAPQTRQTTARLNGPSPPPSKFSPPKSTSPPTKSSPNSLILTQKATTVRPNILRSVPEGQDSVNKIRHENGISELSSSNVKSSKAKTMHIPGLPSCLTIERIENDTAVCVYCRNPGTLTFCDNCSISYHASCRSSSPPPSRLCSKCVQSRKEDECLPPTTIIKTDEELEEKERERYEQRERNSDLRLQVYELEKRSQLLGQSFQLQNRLRQDLLTKQEKTQKSIKRLVDFIKLMQLRPPNSSQPSTTASVSSQPQPTSSPSQVISPVPQTSNQPNVNPISPSTPALPIQLMSSTPVIHASVTSPIHQSFSSSSAINNNVSIAIRNQSSTLKPWRSSNNHFSSSKNYPIHASVASSVITNMSITNPSTPTTNNKAQESITHYQCLNQKTDITISSVPRHSSTITSPVIAPSQPFEAIKSPPPARYPDSSPSHPRKNIPPMTTLIAATSLSWNQQPKHQQADRKYVASPELLESSPSSPQTFNLVAKNQLEMNPSEQLTSASQTIRKNPVIYSTHCSQAITSPIPAPVVSTSHCEIIPIPPHQNQLQSVSIDGSPKTSPVREEQETAPPNSPNT